MIGEGNGNTQTNQVNAQEKKLGYNYNADPEIMSWRSEFPEINLNEFIVQNTELPVDKSTLPLERQWSTKTISGIFACNRNYYFYKHSSNLIFYGKLGCKEVKQMDIYSYLSKKSTGIEIISLTISENFENSILVIFLSTLDFLFLYINNYKSSLSKIILKLNLIKAASQLVWKNNVFFFSSDNEIHNLVFDQAFFKYEDLPISAVCRKHVSYCRKIVFKEKIDLFEISKVYDLFTVVSGDQVYILDGLGIALFTYKPNFNEGEKILDIKNYRRKLEESPIVASNPDNVFRYWEMVILQTSKNRIFIHDISLMEVSEINEVKSRIAVFDLETLFFLPRGKAIINLIEVSDDNSKIFYVSQNFKSIIMMEINKTYHAPDPKIGEIKMIVPFADRYEACLLSENSSFIFGQMNWHKNQFLFGEQLSKISETKDYQRQHVFLFVLSEDGKISECLVPINNFFKRSEKRGTKKKSSEIFFDNFIIKRDLNVQSAKIDATSEVISDLQKQICELESEERIKFNTSTQISSPPPVFIQDFPSLAVRKIELHQSGHIGLVENANKKIETNQKVDDNLFIQLSGKGELLDNPNIDPNKKLAGMHYLINIEEISPSFDDKKNPAKKFDLNVDNNIESKKDNQLDRLQDLMFSTLGKTDCSNKLISHFSEVEIQKAKKIDLSTINQEFVHKTEEQVHNFVKLNLHNCEKKLLTKASLKQKETKQEGENTKLNSDQAPLEKHSQGASEVPKRNTTINENQTIDQKVKTEETGLEFHESLIKVMSFFHANVNKKMKREKNEFKKQIISEFQFNLQNASKFALKVVNEESSKNLEKTFLIFLQKLIAKNFENFSGQVEQTYKQFRDKVDAKNLSRKYALDSLSKTMNFQNETFEEINSAVKNSVEKLDYIKNQTNFGDLHENLGELFNSLADIEKQQKILNDSMEILNERIDRDQNKDRADQRQRGNLDSGEGVSFSSFGPGVPVVVPNYPANGTTYPQINQQMPWGYPSQYPFYNILPHPQLGVLQNPNPQTEQSLSQMNASMHGSMKRFDTNAQYIPSNYPYIGFQNQQGLYQAPSNIPMNFSKITDHDYLNKR